MRVSTGAPSHCPALFLFLGPHWRLCVMRKSLCISRNAIRNQLQPLPICTNCVSRPSHRVGHRISIRDFVFRIPASFHGTCFASLDVLASGRTLLLVRAFTGAVTSDILAGQSMLRVPGASLAPTLLHPRPHKLEPSQVLVMYYLAHHSRQSRFHLDALERSSLRSKACVLCVEFSISAPLD